MSQEQLPQAMANLALDPSQPQVAGHKKSRRQNRAFHNFNNPNAAGPPQMQPGMNAQAFGGVDQFGNPMSQQTGQPSTPQMFNSPMMNGGSFTGSPQTPAFNDTPQMNMGTPAFQAPQTFSSNQVDSMSSGAYQVSFQRWKDQIDYLSKVFMTSKDSVPPLPTTAFYSVDEGCCHPTMMSLTMSNVPEDEHLRQATKLPLGVTLQPFIDVITPDGSGVPLIAPQVGQTDVSAPLRCSRCRAYANPGFRFMYDGSFVCNICEVKSKPPVDQITQMDQSGNIIGMDQRHELRYGSVDVFAPSAYNAIQGVAPVPLHYIFVIDVSLMSCENGGSMAVVDAVRQSIEYIVENQEKCKIAIMTYDNKLKFYNLRPELDEAQEYIVGEITDVFIPFFNGLFVTPNESMNVISDTLRKIEDFIMNDRYSHVPDNCYGAALEAAKLALDEFTGQQGGKIMCSLGLLPNKGNGNMSIRRDDNTKQSLQCDNDFYNKLSHSLLRSNISVDLFITSAAFVDMATVSCPVTTTSGSLKYYPHFRKDYDQHLVVNDMVENISNIVGYQGLLKVRCSTGLDVDQYFSKSVDYSDKDPMIPVLTKQTNMDVLFKYTDKLKAGKDVHFQTAILYTDFNGVRKIRSINCNGAVNKNIHEIFKFMNQNAMVRIMIKDVIRTLGNCDFVKIRSIIDQKIVDILTQYRALVNGNSQNQLVLPDSLRTLHMYMLAFEKSQLMAPNTSSTRGNDRIYDLAKYETFDSTRLAYKLYPQIIPLHVLLEENDLTFSDANSKLLEISESSVERLSIRASFSALEKGGCYIIFQGDVAYLWIDANTNRMLLEDLLGVDSSVPLQDISLFSGILPETDKDINEKVRNVLNYWCGICGKNAISLVLLRPTIDQYYNSVMTGILCEDQTMNKIDNHDNYLIKTHAAVSEKIKKEDFVRVANNSQSGFEHLHQKFVQL